MISLSTRGVPCGVTEPLVCKVVRDPVQEVDWPSRVLVTDQWPTEEFAQLDALLCASARPEVAPALGIPIVYSAPVGHLNQGDVVALDPSGTVRTLYRRGSAHNTLFATERCNSFCVMCSQPPRDVDDTWRVEEMLRTVALIDPDLVELGISGGEPTLLHDGLISVIQACRDRLPNTALHILSNGRLFRYASLASAVANVRHPDVMFGIPVYSDMDFQHDHVVQARGAFEDTMLGLQNLGRVGVPVEVRIVVHRLTYERLESLAEFVYRNITFASHVTFMGLEATGFAKGNMASLWIDPGDYREQLERATLFLATRRMRVSIYNHQLCTIPPSVWEFARQSISDWKNEYLPVCDECSVRSTCAGFFSFNLKHCVSKHVAPILSGNPSDLAT